MVDQNDETSRALLDAAHRLLASDGADALTVRRIATEAGMSTMNVYSRFGGKDGVIDRLYIAGFEQLHSRLAEVPTTDDVHRDLRAVAEAYRSFALEFRTYYAIMFGTAIRDFQPSPEASDFAMQGFEVFTERVRGGQRAGRLIDDDAHPATAVAAWLWATCHGLISLELDNQGTEQVAWGDVYEMGIQAALRGVHPANVTVD